MTLANNLLRMLRRKKVQEMDVTLGTHVMLMNKSQCKHRVHKIHDMWKNEYLFCVKCKRTCWGWYEGKRLWARLDDENAVRIKN